MFSQNHILKLYLKIYVLIINVASKEKGFLAWKYENLDPTPGLPIAV